MSDLEETNEDASMPKFVVQVDTRIEEEHRASILVEAPTEAAARAKIEQMIDDDEIDIGNHDYQFWAIDGDYSGYYITKVEPYDQRASITHGNTPRATRKMGDPDAQRSM
jgi:hypothetical protein